MPAHPADQMYSKLLDLFGTGGNELFTMEWPARALDETTYAYPITDVYSSLIKPQVVAEEEFRLSDGLIDTATIVGGVNGSLLSMVYEEALNQLVPSYSGLAATYQADKEKLRAWLLEEVSAEYIDDDGNPQTVTASRIEVYDLLNERYLRAVAQWDQVKTEKLDAARNAAPADQQQALDEYAHWLAEEAQAEEGELESKFADLVVKGYYHEVRNAIATLDVSTPGEAIEDAKAHMRASGLSSLDESETIYPVQFQPADWAQGLSTNFTAEDLLLDPAAMQAQLLSKQQQIAQLEEEIAFLKSTQTGDPNQLQKDVDAAQAQLDADMTALTNQFASNVLTVARMYFGSIPQGAGQAESEGLNDALKAAGIGALTPEQWDAIQKGFTAVASAQQAVTSASAKLTNLQAALMEAKTTDTAAVVAQLTAQVGTLQQQVQQLQTTLFSSQGQSRLQTLATVGANGDVTYDPSKDPNYDATAKTYTMLPTPMPAPGEWFDITMTFSSSDQYSASQADASASNTSWNVDLFFGSASGQSSSSSSSSAAEMKVTDTTFSIGFRAMKVTIDRGGWFDPTLFKASAELYHLGADTADGGHEYVKISNGPLQGDWNGTTAPAQFATLREGILPSYPTAFIVVKDVTINIGFSGTDASQSAQAASSASSNSGGIFCFSVSSSSSSSSSSQTATSAAIQQNTIIKIPGPQILGWFQEYVAEDLSTEYTAMPPGFIPDTPAQLTADTSNGAGGDGGVALTAGAGFAPSLLASAAGGGDGSAAGGAGGAGVLGAGNSAAANETAIGAQVDDLLNRPTPPRGTVSTPAPGTLAVTPGAAAPAAATTSSPGNGNGTPSGVGA
jgi:hypothetical protein